MEAVRKIDRCAERVRPASACDAFPAGLYPQVAINDKKFYPIYAKCIELDIPFCSTAGVPGPRVPYAPQDVALIDEVCWFFPELKFVTRHGCEPWTDARGEAAAEVAEPLLLDHRVRAEVLPEGHHRLREHARRRQGHLRRATSPPGSPTTASSRELPDVPFRDHVWPKFLRENAQRVLQAPETQTAMSATTQRSSDGARREVGVIDTMIGFPAPREEQLKLYDFIRKQTHDAESQEWEFPAQYMFKDVPHYEPTSTIPVEMLVAEDGPARHHQGAHRLADRAAIRRIALEHYPDRFVAVVQRRPEPGHGRGAQARRGRASARRQGARTAGAPA